MPRPRLRRSSAAALALLACATGCYDCPKDTDYEEGDRFEVTVVERDDSTIPQGLIELMPGDQFVLVAGDWVERDEQGCVLSRSSKAFSDAGVFESIVGECGGSPGKLGLACPLPSETACGGGGFGFNFGGDLALDPGKTTKGKMGVHWGVCRGQERISSFEKYNVEIRYLGPS